MLVTKTQKVLFALEILDNELAFIDEAGKAKLLELLGDQGSASCGAGRTIYKVWDAVAETIRNPSMGGDWE